MSSSDFSKSIISSTPTPAPGAAAKALRWIADLAIDGNKFLPSARSSAGGTLAHHKGNVDAAIDRVVLQHTSMAGAQGFATNVGGIIAAMIGMPANITGIAIVQTRMVASIAHLRGYDITDSRVRQAILMCLLGKKNVDSLVNSQKLPGSPMVIATAPAIDAALEQQIAEHLMGALMSQSGGKQAVSLVAKRIPVVGGGVALVTDGYNTIAVGRYAREQFVSRRPTVKDQSVTD